MSKTLRRVQELVERGEIWVSEHGYDEMAEEEIVAGDVIAGADRAILVEDYPDYPKGPCVLVLQRDRDEKPLHVVWGIRRGASSPAVVVTAYRPDPELWSSDFRRRKQ
jgi:hypothetical protein